MHVEESLQPIKLTESWFLNCRLLRWKRVWSLCAGAAVRKWANQCFCKMRRSRLNWTGAYWTSQLWMCIQIQSAWGYWMDTGEMVSRRRIRCSYRLSCLVNNPKSKQSETWRKRPKSRLVIWLHYNAICSYRECHFTRWAISLPQGTSIGNHHKIRLGYCSWVSERRSGTRLIHSCLVLFPRFSLCAYPFKIKKHLPPEMNWQYFTMDFISRFVYWPYLASLWLLFAC